MELCSYARQFKMTDTRSEAFLRMVCFCLFLPFVGKGAKKHKRSNVTAGKPLWILTASLFHLSGQDSANTKEVIFQGGGF